MKIVLTILIMIGIQVIVNVKIALVMKVMNQKRRQQMKVPAKGKAVMFGHGCVAYSMGVTDDSGCLAICYTNKLDICSDIVGIWQEVEITAVVHVPEEGKMVLCWNGNSRPKEPAIRRSSGVLSGDKLSIYDYVTPKGVHFGVSTALHWEEME